MDCVHIRRHGCTVFVFVTTPRQRASSPKKPIKQKNSSDAAENLCWVHRFLHHISASCSKTHLFTLMIRRKKPPLWKPTSPQPLICATFMFRIKLSWCYWSPAELWVVLGEKPLEIWVKREKKKGRKNKKIEHSWEIVWDGSCWSWSKTVCFIDWQAVF